MSERNLAAPWGDEEVMAAIRAQARLVAREEIASLCGLVLRRLQETRSDEPHLLEHAVVSAFAEGLRDFGGTTFEPGEAA